MNQQRNTSIPPEILASVRRIEIRTRRLVEEVFSGEYHSVFKGTPRSSNQRRVSAVPQV